jgi:CRISPR-associated protein Cas1
MAVLYVREQGSSLCKRGGRLLVEKDGKQLLEIPLRETDSVAVFGNVQVTTQALSELLERSIPLAFFTRNGRLKGHLAPEAAKNVPLRLAQYKASQDEARALALAKASVRAKLLNCAALITDYRAHYPSAELEQAADTLACAADKAMAASSHSELLGCEGAGAAAYFRAFGAMNRSGLPFETRRMHPPPDPVNALLSLGYTLAMNELRAAAEARGLEPYIGFLHQIHYGRPSLALDLLEPFRPAVADRLTLRLINERILKAEDFARRLSSPGGVILTPEAFKRFLGHYESAVTESRKAAPRGLREAMREDVGRLAHALEGGGPFQPYLELD